MDFFYTFGSIFETLVNWCNNLHYMDVSMPHNKHAYAYTYIKQDPRTGCEQGPAACCATDNDLTLKFGSLISDSIYHV